MAADDSKYLPYEDCCTSGWGFEEDPHKWDNAKIVKWLKHLDDDLEFDNSMSVKKSKCDGSNFNVQQLGNAEWCRNQLKMDNNDSFRFSKTVRARLMNWESNQKRSNPNTTKVSEPMNNPGQMDMFMYMKEEPEIAVPDSPAPAPAFSADPAAEISKYKNVYPPTQTNAAKKSSFKPVEPLPSPSPSPSSPYQIHRRPKDDKSPRPLDIDDQKTQTISNATDDESSQKHNAASITVNAVASAAVNISFEPGAASSTVNHEHDDEKKTESTTVTHHVENQPSATYNANASEAPKRNLRRPMMTTQSRLNVVQDQDDGNEEAKMTFKIRIAVDFGTDGIALAYATSKDNVFVHTAWANGKYRAVTKPKTIILLDKEDNNTVINMGMEAKDSYMMMTTMQHKWLLFERFKMALYKGDGIKKNDDDEKGMEQSQQDIKRQLTATNGQKVNAEVVFVGAFRKLEEFAIQMRKRKKIKGIKKKDIQWIITVPAIWNDTAKYKMRSWAIKAGLVDKDLKSQCKIVYEPDCASLSVQNDENKEFKKGERYILIDAGGGTVDIACHEISDGMGVKEILHPSGGPWGGCYIDNHFEELLNCIFAPEWIENFKMEKPSVWTLIINNFQKSKESFYVDSDEKREGTNHNVQLPTDFIYFMQDKLEEAEEEEDELTDWVESKTVFGHKNKVELDDEAGLLEMDIVIWKALFDRVIDPTIKHTHGLLAKPKMKGTCKYCCLVGGLSTSTYFRERLTNAFGPKSDYKLEMVIPKRPMLSVVRGAALMGVIDDYITARVLPYTYGYILALPESEAEARGIPDEHLEDNVVEAPDHPEGWLIQNCFEALATKGEEMKAGKTKTSHAQRAKATDKTSTISLYFSDKEDPKVKDDGERLGDIVIEWDENDEAGCGVTVEFHFTEALLKAEVYKDSDPNNKQTKYITNYKG